MTFFDPGLCIAECRSLIWTRLLLFRIFLRIGTGPEWQLLPTLWRGVRRGIGCPIPWSLYLSLVYTAGLWSVDTRTESREGERKPVSERKQVCRWKSVPWLLHITSKPFYLVLVFPRWISLLLSFRGTFNSMYRLGSLLSWRMAFAHTDLSKI